MGRDIREGFRSQRIKYRALPSQKTFHRSRARFKGFSGPVGSGKSLALCQEAIRMSFLNPGRMGLIGAPTFPMLRDATQVTLLELLDVNGIGYEFLKAENQLTFEETGSKILFRSLEEFERLRGTNLAWFGVDELTYTEEGAWLRLEGRLRDPLAKRLCGFAVWTPRGYDWVYRRFVKEPIDGYCAVIAKPFENTHLLDQVPDFYERLRSSYDAKFYSQEVLGEYLNIGADRVYHAFDRARNVKDVVVNPRRALLWALDFNVDPMCSLVVQIDRGRINVIDEIVLSRASTEDACDEFKNRFDGQFGRVVVYGDASGSRLQTAGTSDYKIIKRFFAREGYPGLILKVPASNPSVRERVNLVNAKLQSAAGENSIAISPKCKELVLDLEDVCFKPQSTVIDKDKDPRRTHLSDALGYLIWQESSEPAPIGEQTRRLIS